MYQKSMPSSGIGASARSHSAKCRGAVEEAGQHIGEELAKENQGQASSEFKGADSTWRLPWHFSTMFPRFVSQVYQI